MTDHRITRRSRAALAAALAVAAAMLIGSCGIPTERHARDIPIEAIGPAAEQSVPSTTSTLPPESSSRETLYLVRTGDPASSGSERLEALVTDVPNASDPAQVPRLVIERLIGLSPTDLSRPGLVNALPTGTRVLSATVGADGVLDLNLSGLSSVESALQRLAVAQIVFTVTGLPSQDITGVRFSLDGTPAAVPVEEGTKGAGQVVTRDDYPKLRDQVSSTGSTSGSG